MKSATFVLDIANGYHTFICAYEVVRGIHERLRG